MTISDIIEMPVTQEWFSTLQKEYEKIQFEKFNRYIDAWVKRWMQ